MSLDEVLATRGEVIDWVGPEYERDLLRAADELHDGHRISDATWTALSANYDTQQLMDIVFTCGQYTLVSMFLNTAGVEIDEGIPDLL